MHEIGIRQGRLTAVSTGSIHGFPSFAWREELARARRCGFDTVEWLFAAHDCEGNPVWTDAGVAEVQTAATESRMRVRSLCADYFLVHPFFRVSERARRQSSAVLSRLIALSARLGVRVLVLPVLEASEIRTMAEMMQLRESLEAPLAVAEAHGVRVAVETDLAGREARDLVELRPHPALGVCYDTGNAAAKAQDPAADVRALGRDLCHVHIKDRPRNGPSVRLGHGDVDFEAFFGAVAEIGYEGLLILEAASVADPVPAAMVQLAFIKAQVSSLEP